MWLIVSRRTFTSDDGVDVGKDFSSQPMKYCISLESTCFSAHEHLSNQARQIAQDCRFSQRQHPERPRPVSTVYFIKVLDISDNW